MAKQANLRVLYLRTFRNDRDDVFDTLRITDSCTNFGTLVMIGSVSEHAELRSKLDDARLDGSSFDDHVDFIEATDANWKHHAISEILAADAIIMWLRPKEQGFPPLEKTGIPAGDFQSYYKTPISSTRTGAGLLMEVSYLSRLLAIEKTILFGHGPDLAQVEAYVRVAQLAAGGDVFVVRGGQAVSALPRISALDKELGALADVEHWISYSREPQQQDILRISNEIGQSLSRIVSRAQKSAVPKNALVIGTSNEQRPVFPDYSEKIVGFTPVEDLVSLPARSLIEQSIETVKKSATVDLNQLECPHCQSDVSKIFFYTTGLVSSVSDTIRGWCQHCARRVTLMGDVLMDM